MNEPVMNEPVKFDKETAKWFETRPGYCTTVVQCEHCGLYYKPELGHKCKVKKTPAPTRVDIAPVIRCKDCKHSVRFGGRVDKERWSCNLLLIDTEPYFYCKNGSTE